MESTGAEHDADGIEYGVDIVHVLAGIDLVFFLLDGVRLLGAAFCISEAVPYKITACMRRKNRKSGIWQPSIPYPSEILCCNSIQLVTPVLPKLCYKHLLLLPCER